MSKLTVTLQPIEGYFFDNENRRSSGYFPDYTPYPQQTSIVEMMRWYILSAWNEAFPEQNLLYENGNIRNKKLAKELIGETGFRMSVTWRYGKIYSLSELMLFDGKSVLLPSEPRNDSDNPFLLRTIPGQTFFNNKRLDYIPVFDDYDSKQPEKEGWVSSSGQFFSIDDLFLKEVKKQEALQGTFNKQVFFHMANRDLRFVFQVDVDDDIKNMLIGQQIINLGGSFKFIVKVSSPEYILFTIPSPMEKAKYYSSNPKFIKLVLTSDACFRGNPYMESIIGVSRLKHFRLPLDKGTSYEKSDKKVIHGNLLTMIERGAVFYFSDGNQLSRWSTSCGVNSSDFRNIGYNQYVIIQPSVG